MQEAKCFCGATKINFKNDPMMLFMCHCTDCKVLFDGSSKVFVYTELDVEISGEHKTFSYEGGSGSLLHVTFCSSCGMNECRSRIYLRVRYIYFWDFKEIL